MRARRRTATAAGVVALAATTLALLTGTAGPARAFACTVAFPGVTAPTTAASDGAQALTLKTDGPGPDRVTRPDCDIPRILDLTFSTSYVVRNDDTSTGPKVPTPKVRIILPQGYDPAAARKYPVLYLLHGGGLDAGYRDWTGGDVDVDTGKDPATTGHAYKLVAANPQADANLIVVMVEGAVLGQYADWRSSMSTGNAVLSPRYESWITGQLVRWVDQNLRTRATAQGRAVAGYSMGGMGALNLAARHPDLFNTVASFSGVTDIEDDGSGPFARITAGYVLSVGMIGWGNGDPSAIFGPTWQGGAVNQGHGPWWTYYNPVKNTALLAGKDVWVATGANDPTKPKADRRHCEFTVWPWDAGVATVESAICVGNTQYDTRIRQTWTPAQLQRYTYQETPGKYHDFRNWNYQLQIWLPHAMTELARP